ncbi:hypothetical protein WMY93_033496 [Mugilogobius chulae]|uniref:Uncharacterized protein n=1 Tax=Mugilogobius chulae TaxID=88201 RepID=A0AAW0MH50_9GOBI
MKSDYVRIKSHNSQSGAERKVSKWFQLLDAIYGHRPASCGREAGYDSATSLLLSTQRKEEESSTDSEAGVMSDSTGESPAIRSPTPLPLPPSPLPATPGPPSVSVSEGATSETPRTPSRPNVSGKRKRGHDQSAIVAALHEMQAEDRQQQDLDRIQRDKHLDRLLTEAREAREHEDAIRRETAAFNQSFLAVLGKLAEAIGRQHH